MGYGPELVEYQPKVTQTWESLEVGFYLHAASSLLLFFYKDADELLAHGFGGDRSVGLDFDAFEFCGDAGLVSIDRFGDGIFIPGVGVEEIGGELGFDGDGGVQGFAAYVFNDEVTCLGLCCREVFAGVSDSGFSAQGVFEEVFEAILIGIGFFVPEDQIQRGQWCGGDPGCRRECRM